MNAPTERNVSTMIRLALIGRYPRLLPFSLLKTALFSKHIKLVAWGAVFGLCLTSHAIAAPPTTKQPSSSPEQNASEQTLSEVGTWIEKLGHPSYATRIRAREQLQRMGLQAFDELHAAQYHADSEIAMAARHLVSSLLVSWSTESDPEAVRDALDEYGAQNETERQNRMDRLAELPDRQGLAALCRLARFETSLRLSREAALAVMRSPLPEDEATCKREADIIREVLGPNDRRAADWLRAYADDLSAGSYSANAWRELIRDQRRMMDDGSDPTSSRPAVLELVQVCATRAATTGMRDEALALSIEHLDLVPPRAREVIDACSWAIDNQMHSLVLELRKRHGELFSRQPILLYGAAEALLAQKDSEGAEKLANEALVVDPLPQGGSDEAAKLSPKVIEENAQRHREVGRELESRGLFHWAEREYRHIIDASAIDAPIAATARIQLANMLAELERHEDCVAFLEPILKRADEDEIYKRRLSTSQIVSRLKATMFFQQGLAALAKKDLPEARNKFSAALELDATNADILIAMYRIDGDAAWKEEVRRAIASLALSFENQIEAFKLQVQPRLRLADAGIHLAEYLNQYAWLVANTEGNYQRALEYSLYSLELNPDVAAQLDTAGRCYYAVNDIPNALKMQRRAVKLMPHSPPLLRQLAMFEEAEKALENKKEKPQTTSNEGKKS
jgi:tetratricopeptide (TPR) repeat protein